MTTPVTSVQRGSVTITSADGTTKNVTISSVDATKSIVMFTFRANDTGPRTYRHVFRAYLSSNTNIQFTRNTAAGAADVIVEYTVVEFTSVVSLQTGTVAVTADPTNTTISAVTLANAFVITSWETDGFAGWGNSNVGTFLLTSTTNFRADPTSAPSAGNQDLRYTVVELNTISVQSGANTFASSDFQDTVTISAVTTGETLVLSSGNTVSMAPDNRNLVRWTLNSSTQIVGDRANPGSDFGQLSSYQVIQWTGNNVTKGNNAIANTSTSANPTFSAVGASSFVMNLQTLQNSLGDTVDATGGSESLWHTIKLDAGLNGVTLERIGSSRALNVGWAVVDLTGGGGSPVTFTQGAIIG